MKSLFFTLSNSPNDNYSYIDYDGTYVLVYSLQFEFSGGCYSKAAIIFKNFLMEIHLYAV